MTYKLIVNVKKFLLSSVKRFGTEEEKPPVKLVYFTKKSVNLSAAGPKY